MSKPKVYATHPMFEAARKLIESRCEVEYWRGPNRPPRATLLEKVAGKDALICLLTEKINDELLAAGSALRIVANVAVGFDNIDVPACTRRKVFASNTPGVLDETTADFAWTLLMAVARRAAGFNMRVIYSDAIRAPLDTERELHAEYVPMDRLFAEADFISLHVPLLPETRHLISTARLAQMKPTAFIINTSRGPVVDEAALVSALEAKKIGGAALDVYENEPQVHPGLVSRQDVILAPHIASASVDTRTKMSVMACENVIAALDGRKPPNALNPERFGA
jgi:glyoxylate reductase